jgi:hypothetical protein
MAGTHEGMPPRLMALLAEAARYDQLIRAPRGTIAGFMLGAAVGLALGLIDPAWSETSMDDLTEWLAADDGRSPSAHRAELWAMAHRLIDEVAAIEREERA